MASQDHPGDNQHYDIGINASIKSGNIDANGDPTQEGVGPVWYDSNRVGAGPDPSTANGNLKDWRRAGSDGIDLWINIFSADFSITGVNAQSHLKRDFFPRYFTQPEYVVQGQCATQYDYNRLSRYIRASQINQLAGAAPAGGHDLLQLTLKGDPTNPGRSTKGGNSPWTLLGYIKSAPAGAQRFVVAPTFSFTFVLANATQGIMADLDAMLTTSSSGFVGTATSFLSNFAASIPDPNIPAPKPWGADTGKAVKPPSSDPAGPHDSGVGSDANRGDVNPITASFQDFSESLFGND